MIKDAEIDLTEHRDFGEQNSSPIFIRTANNGEVISNISTHIEKIFRKQVYGDIPWSVSPIYQSYYKYDGLVALGNKEQRKYVIETQLWGSSENISCDCCGKKYVKIPWKRDWGLCEQCAEEHYKILNSFPWDFSNNIGIQRQLGWINER
jgi:hypothetical protein